MDSHEESRSDAGQRAADAARKAREYTSSVVEQQKQRAATGLQQLSSSMRDTAGRMQDERDLTLAGYAEAAAGHIDRAASYVAQQDLGRMLGDAQRFARRRPELVVGGMFVAGVALARFLKASTPAAPTRDNDTPEDLYVPHSKRADPRDGVGENPQTFAPASSPRGISPEPNRRPNLSRRGTEAAGGAFRADSESPLSNDTEPPPSNPEAF